MVDAIKLPGVVDRYGKMRTSKFDRDVDLFKRTLIPIVSFPKDYKGMRDNTPQTTRQLRQFAKDASESLFENMGTRFGGVGFRVWE
jgi:hypothetical protein